MLRPAESGSEIIDKRHDDRVVALVHDNEEAIVIMAYLNGHAEIASRLHADFTERLDKSRSGSSYRVRI